jgi:hypothetical protein
MALRRAFLTWQFVAAAVLPLWLLVGYAVWGSSVAGLFGVLLLVPVVALAELGLALLFSGRRRVRRRPQLDPLTVSVLTAFQVGVVGIGLFGPATAWFAVLAVAAAITGFWLGTRLLVQDVRTRVQETFPAVGRPPASPQRPPIDRGEYVVIKPSSH